MLDMSSDLNDRPDKPSSIDLDVFPMRIDSPNLICTADDAENADHWDILVTAHWDGTGDIELLEEIENLTREEADLKVAELAEKYGVTPNWVNCP